MIRVLNVLLAVALLSATAGFGLTALADVDSASAQFDRLAKRGITALARGKHAEAAVLLNAARFYAVAHKSVSGARTTDVCLWLVRAHQERKHFTAAEAVLRSCKGEPTVRFHTCKMLHHYSEVRPLLDPWKRSQCRK